jgi:replicative superfamily II helicase
MLSSISPAELGHATNERTTSWTNHVKNDEVLHRVKEERNILCTIKQRKADWIGHIVHRNCMEGKIEGTRRQERRLK